MQMRCFKELQTYGADQVLTRIYGSLYQPQPELGYDVTLLLDLEHMSEDKGILPLTRMAHQEHLAVETQRNGRTLRNRIRRATTKARIAPHGHSLPPRRSHLHPRTPRPRHCYFLNYIQGRNGQNIRKSVPAGICRCETPAVDPECAAGFVYKPRAAAGTTRSSWTGGFRRYRVRHIWYIPFKTVLFPRHFQGEAAFDAISRIQMFRDYFHFHIKASKAYMHSRMRAKVTDFLKVLNRAKPEKVIDAKTAGYAFYNLVGKHSRDRDNKVFEFNYFIVR